MAFLSDLRRFYGTGEKNPAGQSLEEFLEHYNPAKYESLCNTADIVVVRCEEISGTVINRRFRLLAQA